MKSIQHQKGDMKRMTISLSDALAEKLEQYCKEKEITQNNAIRGAIEGYLKNVDRRKAKAVKE